jgi:phenylacetaldehyde dehydrogenase
VLYKDADLDVAIPARPRASSSTRASAATPGRLYVEREVFDEVVQGISDEAKRIKVGPGLDPDTQMGPLISAEQHDKVLGYMSSGVDAGARASAGGGRVGDRGYFVEPTVLTDTTPDMQVVREEIFGPVVCAIPFDSEGDDVIQRATTRTSASRRGSGRATSARRTARPTACAPARCGSTATAFLTPRCLSAATSSRVGVGEMGTTHSRTINALENYLETKSVVTQLA